MVTAGIVQAVAATSAARVPMDTLARSAAPLIMGAVVIEDPAARLPAPVTLVAITTNQVLRIAQAIHTTPAATVLADAQVVT